jgi:hypothetical protein
VVAPDGGRNHRLPVSWSWVIETQVTNLVSASFAAPISLSPTEQATQVVNSPSLRDELAWQYVITDTVASLKKVLEELSEEEFYEGEENRKERVKNKCKEGMKDLANGQSCQYNSVTSSLGTVYCSSGLPGLDMGNTLESETGPFPFTTDWALIRLDGERFPTSKRDKLCNVWISTSLRFQYYQVQANSTRPFVRI